MHRTAALSLLFAAGLSFSPVHARQLSTAERRVADPELNKIKVTAIKRKEAADETATLADKVAGSNDEKFVDVFSQVYPVVLKAKTGISESDAPVLFRVKQQPSTLTMPRKNSIWRDPIFLKNARQLYSQAATSSARIVGGIIDEPPESGADPKNYFPDCVAVGGPDTWCCSGTLLAPNVVVTAGHCAAGCASRVCIGDNILAPKQVINVISAVVHPDYSAPNPFTTFNDLTVLILEHDVVGVAPRAIALTALIDSASSVRAVGYGNTDVLGAVGYGYRRKVDIPVASCSCVIPEDAEARLGCHKDLELVAGYPLLDQDTCRGDSGGPIYVHDGTDWFVCGATSRTTLETVRPCGDGGIYVRLDKYAAWIRAVPGGHWPVSPPGGP